MKKLIEILQSIHPDVDFEKEVSLVEDRILDSFDIVVLISEIENEFGVLIKPKDIVPENFNSIKDIYELIKKTDINEKH